MLRSISVLNGILFEVYPFISIHWSLPKDDLVPRGKPPSPTDLTDHPVIGVLTQEVKFTRTLFTDGFLVNSTRMMNTEFFDSAYVKFLEQAGARVVPIFVDRDQSYFEKMFNLTNGILLPGGAAHFGVSSLSCFIYQ